MELKLDNYEELVKYLHAYFRSVFQVSNVIDISKLDDFIYMLEDKIKDDDKE